MYLHAGTQSIVYMRIQLLYIIVCSGLLCVYYRTGVLNRCIKIAVLSQCSSTPELPLFVDILRYIIAYNYITNSHLLCDILKRIYIL